MRPLRQLRTWTLDVIDGQRGRLFLWLPVLFGCGIGLFFGVPMEPSIAALRLGLAVFLAVSLLAWRLPAYSAPPAVALAVVMAGFLVAGYRTHVVAEPVLSFRYYGPVEGRIVHIDRSASDALRLTLDRVTLRDMSPARTPARVRVSLHGPQGYAPLEPGAWVATTAHLSPPPGPTEPGGFDFQRMAWFDGLGAVGYTRVPVLRTAPTDTGAPLVFHRLRARLSAQIQTRIAGQEGAFAAAILTGDRAAISETTEENLRASNLSHLLAISGLHMGLMTGAVFFALRLALALVPSAALRWPIKKMAATGALMAAAFYLVLSGGNVATERAFVMVSVMLVAVLLDRQAISLHAVAVAALLILLWRPEVLPEPGFQMSFAATTALVAVFSLVRRLQLMDRWPSMARAAATVMISSAVAGIATAPVAAAHFNRIADFGLIANLAAVPVMGAVIMPAAVLALALAPIGLSGVGFAIMTPAISWILGVAATVAGWEGAVSRLPAPPMATLPLLALGSLFVILWRGRAQRWGGLAVLAGFVMWGMAERPALLVSEDGGLVGRLGPQGRWLSKPRGAGFAAESWLENDGDVPDQAHAAARDRMPLDLGGVRITHVTGRGWQARVTEACTVSDVVITNQTWEGPLPDPCLLIDARYLRASGALAFDAVRGGVHLTTGYEASGARFWNTPALRNDTARSAQAARLARGPAARSRDIAASLTQVANR